MDYDPSLRLNTGPLIDPRWDEDRRENADQQSVDLIVMGTHARRIPLGSVATEVVRSAHQPLLLINRDTARATENAAYAVVPTVTVGRPHGQVHDDDRYAADDDR